ncbi:uncharacterized protein LOC129610871 [Condylostylus longicornis]|uniref:uncharacterized protein LOC129610871 n=1 Tax=Condylostylus longicornis TaxID=2530218 RepID=UPI00244DA7C2|nr:uncharacterized protein LOC129610871 [Condylostylus longicornis]
MSCENLFYFFPCILNLPREKPDYYNKSRYKTPKEISAAKKESECTKKFVREIIFNKIRQMRINAIRRSMIERQTFLASSKDSAEIPKIQGSMNFRNNEKFTEIETKKFELDKRDSEHSNGSRKSASSGGYVTTTTTTKIVTRVIQEAYEEPNIHEVHEVHRIHQNSPSVSKNEFSHITDQTEFKRKFLEETNKYRSKHDAPPLIMSNELCSFAQEWANHLAYNVKGLQHRPRCQYGENLYASKGYQVDGGTAVKSWYDEINNYNFNKPGFSSKTGHFTQLVWKNTKQVGVGMATKNGWIYIAANYSPPGNVLGQFPNKISKMNNFEQECLNEHNKYRVLHGCPPVTLNRDLCNFASEWAHYLARNNILQHRSNLEYGENIYMSSGSTINGKIPVEYWYSESKQYAYGGSNGFNSNCGHFTQVVWKRCEEIGVGFAINGPSTFVVVNYNPPGNFRGEYLENVPPPVAGGSA